MTVPEPTPDHASRGSLFRRVGFLATAVGLTGAFAFSLSGIASTRGAVSPETQAAVVAAQQRSDAAETGTGTFRRGHCHHGDRARGGSAGSGRV
jgi:hypothetical protein